MKAFNFVAIEGRLVDDPIQKRGTTTFILDTEGVKVVAESTLATEAYNYLSKGSRVLVSGTLSYEGGQYVVKAKELNFLKREGQL